MRPSIFVSAALVCLPTCGDAVEAASALENLVAFKGVSPMLLDDTAMVTTVNTEKRHLLARDKDSKPEDGSLDSNVNTTATVLDHRPYIHGAYSSEYDEGSDDSISSESSDSSNGISSHDSIESSDVDAKAKFNRAPHHLYKGLKGVKLHTRFKFKHQTRKQTLAKIDDIKNKGGDDASLKEEDAYLGLLDDWCTLPKYKGELACT